MFSENNFSGINSEYYTLVDLVEPNPFSLKPELSLSSGTEVDYFNQNYLEPSVLENGKLDFSNSPKSGKGKEDFLTGLNTVAPLVVGQPDLIVGGLTLASAVLGGSKVQFNYSIKNIGNAAASFSKTQYYLSGDASLDSSDLFLGESNFGLIAAGKSLTRNNESITLDSTLDTGAYYFFVVADSAANNPESNETNNTFSQSVQIVKPDLVVEPSSISIPDSLIAGAGDGVGKSVTFTYTASNQGDGSAKASKTKYYLSNDTILDSNDTYLGDDVVPTLAANTSVTRSDSFSLSAATKGGTYYFLTQVDANNNAVEKDEDNNIAAKKIDIIGLPDLVMQSFNLPNESVALSSISIPYTVQNIGGSTSGTSSTRFYLSKNATYEATDLLVGLDNVEAIAVDQSISRVVKLNLNATTQAGDYYVLALVDGANSVKEGNEANNFFSSPQTITIAQPDLEISQFSPLANGLTVDSSVEVTYTISNQGNAAAIASLTKYYLSLDETFDASDSYLGDDSIPSLSVGATLNRTDSFILNTNLEGETYYFLALADSTKVIAESNESNNLASTTAINSLEQPDLMIEPLANPLVANKGESLSLSYTIENQGSVDAEASTTKFYLSTDPNLNSSDIALGSDAVASLASAATSTEEVSLLISDNLNTGTYYVLAQADGEAAIAESDETNNIVYQIVQIVEAPEPDLVVDNLTIPPTVTQGSNLSVTYTILNQGNAEATASLTKFYLSTNATLDSSDLVLGDEQLSYIASNTASTQNLTLAIASNINLGTYYLLAQADSGSVLSESDETNNLSVQTFQIIEPPKPDLLIGVLAPPPSVEKGSSLIVPYIIQNQGDAAAIASNTKFYLSADSTLDDNDIDLGDDSVAAIASQGESPEDTLLAIGNTISAGTYYLLAQADGEGNVTESNENNNLSASTIQITEPGIPDLSINPLSVNVNGLNLSVSYTVKNQGSLGAAASTTKFYLSTDNVLEATDTLIGSDAVAALGNGTSSAESAALVVANNLNAGTYHILAQADSDRAISESDETNNITSQTISLKADLVATTLSLANGKNKVTTGYGFTPSYTLKNQGNAIAVASTIKYIISKDTILGNADDYLPTFLGDAVADPALTSEGSRVESNDYLAVYNTLTPGIYNFFVLVDSTGTVTESNEDNNTFSIQFEYQYPPKPDLSVDKLVSPASGNIGSYLNVSYTISNQDTGYVGYSQLGFYLSKDTVVDSSDIDLGSHTVSSDTPTKVPISRNWSLLLDSSKVTSGTYNLIAMVDPNKAASESNETNNTKALGITINSLLLPDLSITDLSFASFGMDGQPILTTGSLFTLAYTLTNAGGAVKGSKTDFYLSTDTVFDSTDKLVGTHNAKVLAANSSNIESASVYFNPSLALLGTNIYYLLARADAGLGLIGESNETNNVYGRQVTVVNSGYAKFTNYKGHGFVNAAAAVAASIAQAPFANVPNLDRNWGVDLIKAPEVWNAGYTGQGITVAVIDTGVDYNHADLKDNIWVNKDEIAGNGIDDDRNGFVDDVRGWNFVNNNNSPLDGGSHGTHVAGIIAGARNSIGYTGVAPSAKIMPLKVLGGGDQWANVNNAIRYAVDNGARVINMSLGGTTSDPDGRLKEYLQYASERGVIVVSAAGNDNSTDPKMPAVYASQWGLAIGATDPSGNTTSYSNKAGSRGEMAYVTAPGSSTSTLPNNKYGGLSGTSMASPHVAGMVALMLQANPTLNDAQVRQIVTQTAIAGTLSASSLTSSSLTLTTPALENSLIFSIFEMKGQLISSPANLNQ